MTPGQNGLTPIHHIARTMFHETGMMMRERLVVDYLEVDHLSVIRIAEQDRERYSVTHHCP